MLEEWANDRNENTAQLITLHQGDIIWFLSVCVMNVLSRVVPINKVELKKFEKPNLQTGDLKKVSESNFFDQILETVYLNSLRYLALCVWSKLHTEEFVLIPRQMYANEQLQITQFSIIKISERKQNKYHCCGELSLHQHILPCNKTREQQTDIILETVKDELNETRDEKIDTKTSNEIRERVLRDIKHLDKKKFEKASIILEKIEESESLSLDQTSRLMVNKSSTGILVGDFLYDLQQTTSKLSLEHYKVLTFLDISSQLPCNIYAKKLLALSLHEKLQLFVDEPENEESRVSRTEESKASGDDDGSFEDAKDEIQPSSSWANYFLSR